SVAAAHNRKGGLMAVRGGIELPVSYVTLALTLAATGPGKYKIGPSLHPKLTTVGALAGGALAGALIAKMVTAVPPAADEPDEAAPPAAEAAPPAPPAPPAPDEPAT
ncbi:MAG TPA: hypothetical protein VFE59_29475, partial [Trebonia sp.]|nr:hypothetical protein [Trebonia sp.]